MGKNERGNLMATFEGRGACAHCKKGVDVYSDKNGLAYYNCGPCGFRGLHRNRRTSDTLLAGLQRDATPEDGGAPPAPTPIPVKPAGVSPAPKANQNPAPPAPPAPKRAGFLDNFSL
jgi:DNA-directed RNA polymerase subunit RPC12/RpoP